VPALVHVLHSITKVRTNKIHCREKPTMPI
jgi:hypothetical protein